MAFKKVDPDGWKRLLTRILITGDPNSRKTTSLATFPRPLHALIVPGEKGAAALPQEEGITGYAWEQEDSVKLSPAGIVKAVNVLVAEIVGGKHGPVQTLAIDGFHKMYTWMLADITGGLSLTGDEFEPRLYGRAHEEAMHFLTTINLSSVPYAVFTCWAGKEADNPELGSKGGSHVFPDLPGKMAKRIMGEFGVVLYAEVGQAPGPGKEPPATWQLQPEGKVWGAGVKCPPAIARTLPKRVPQDWTKLEALLIKGGQE